MVIIPVIIRQLDGHMVRYFFDVETPDRSVRDAVGMALSDEDLAIAEANMIVLQVLEDALADGRPGCVTVRIRTDQGACLYESSTSPVSE